MRTTAPASSSAPRRWANAVPLTVCEVAGLSIKTNAMRLDTHHHTAPPMPKPAADGEPSPDASGSTTLEPMPVPSIVSSSCSANAITAPAITAPQQTFLTASPSVEARTLPEGVRQIRKSCARESSCWVSLKEVNAGPGNDAPAPSASRPRRVRPLRRPARPLLEHPAQRRAKQQDLRRVIHPQHQHHERARRAVARRHRGAPEVEADE